MLWTRAKNYVASSEVGVTCVPKVFLGSDGLRPQYSMKTVVKFNIGSYRILNDLCFLVAGFFHAEDQRSRYRMPLRQSIQPQ